MGAGIGMFRGLRIRLAAVALVAASLAGGWAYWHNHYYKHLDIHDPGMVYRSAWLEPGAMNQVIERYQIRAVVNLCEPGEMGDPRWESERQTVRNAGARLVELSMPTTVHANDPAIVDHLAVMSNPDNYPMLVHCQHGVTRTAKFLTIYDIVFRGMSADDSLAAQPKYGRQDHNVNVRAFARDFETRHERLFPDATAKSLDMLKIAKPQAATDASRL
jgi:protein tyrosine phosphatase (PTP) superfamily phosphohydrolase (DUF442 family)